MHKPIFVPTPITLTHNDVILRPLTMDDVEGFYLAGQAKELWRWVIPNHCETIEATSNWVRLALENAESGTEVPFAIIDKTSGKFIGSTRYCSIKRNNRSLEIGHTFIQPEYQRTAINTQAKYLLIKHAFEQLGAIRVELRTHESNQKSRNAILRVGANFEGILRKSKILDNGEHRNTALFSIIDTEWPDVKANLEQKIMQYQSAFASQAI